MRRSDHGHDHEHGHDHRGGLRGALREVFSPHSHDAFDSVDDALESSAIGIRAVKISLIALGITAAFQVVILVVSGSIALAADTIHNFSDALTAIPLWIAFVLGRRAATRRYNYGYGRAEDLAGLFVILMIALSAVIAGYEAIRRLVNPITIDHLGWVIAAGIVGFIGNELVAVPDPGGSSDWFGSPSRRRTARPHRRVHLTRRGVGRDRRRAWLPTGGPHRRADHHRGHCGGPSHCRA